MRRRPRPRARRTSSSSSRSSLKMSCWNSYDVISIVSMDVLDWAYERQRELHGGLRIVGHWILLQRSWWGEMKVWGWFARLGSRNFAKPRRCHEIAPGRMSPEQRPRLISDIHGFNYG